MMSIAGLSQRDYTLLCDFVKKITGNVITEDKGYLLEYRLHEVIKNENVGGFQELVNILKSKRYHERLIQKIINVITTHETSFFRDHTPFEVLKTHILPALLKKPDKIRIWSAACSSGQEPYSIAMMVCENFPQLSADRVHIIATDIAENVLEKARSGVYSQLDVNRGLPAKYLFRYFDKKLQDFVVKDRLKQYVTFKSLNLISDWPPLPKLDVIFMRNVMIYFDHETRKILFDKILATMTRASYLILGSQESVIGLHDGFVKSDAMKMSCYQPKT